MLTNTGRYNSSSTEQALRVGIYPYNPGYNPYQLLFANALEAAGTAVVRIPPRKVLPIDHALSFDVNILHLDWPHDLYLGRTPLRQAFKQAMYAWGLHRLRKQAVVWTAHNLVGHDSKDPRYEARMIQRLIEVCDGIVSFSGVADSALRRQYDVPDRVVTKVIHHGHYIDVYENTVSRASARTKLGLRPDAVTVLAFGTIAKYKGFDALIQAFRAAACANAVLLIAGPAKDPALLSHLRDLAARRRGDPADIRIIPETIDARDAQIYFNACDAVALPFRSVLNSGSLLLAMSFGRCVVAPAIGSIPEIAYPRAHFGYDPNAPDGLTDALKRAIRDGELKQRGAEAKRFAAENYGWESAAKGAINLYREILSTRREF